MRFVLAWLYTYRAFLLFVGMEFICWFIIIRNNTYQSAVAFTSANRVTGEIYRVRNGIANYFRLSEVNQALMKENAWLKQQLNRQALTAENAAVPPLGIEYLPAKVINNSVRFTNNLITIDKGLRDGIKAGMGVVTSEGVVGRVLNCSENFALVVSVLNTNVNVSAQMLKNKELCTVHWNGKDFRYVNVLHLASHVAVVKGDTIVTSGYNSVFPENYMIGVVGDVKRSKDDAFWDINLRLKTNFSRLSYVYVVRSRLKPQLDSLHNVSKVPPTP